MRLAGISAILFLLSFPVACCEFAPWPLIFIALMPFFISLERADTYARSFAAGALWGAVISIGMAYWLVNAMIGEYGAPVLTAAVFMALACVLPHGILYGMFGLMYRFLKNSIFNPERQLLFYALALPSLWIMLEYVREIVPVMVPWGSPGYALQPWNLYMQMADIAGLHGITFTVLIVNAVTACLCRDLDWITAWRAFSKPGFFGRAGAYISRSRAPLILLLCAIILPLLYGAVRRPQVRQMAEREHAAGKELVATIVQPNFTQDERWQDAGFMDRVNVCMGLTGRCGALAGTRNAASGTDGNDAAERAGFVIWPETVLNAGRMVNSGLFSFITSRLSGSRVLVAGGVRREIGTGGVYNSAYIVSGREDVTFYDKNVLLPYSETAPFGRIFGAYYTAPSEFLQGATPPAARTDAGIIGLSICFEAVYPWHVRRSVRDGAGLLVNISNDGWFGRTSEPVMHLRQASVRAIENRRFMVRASNNGYSAIITPAGEVIAKSRLFTRECINGGIVMLRSMTPFTLLGEWIIYAAAGVLVAMLAVFIVKK